MLIPRDAAASARVKRRRGTASIGRSRERLGIGSLFAVTAMQWRALRFAPPNLWAAGRGMWSEESTDGPNCVGREWPDLSTLEDAVGEVVAVVSPGPQVHDLGAVGGLVEARRDLLGGSSACCIAIPHDRDASARQEVRPRRMPGVRSWDRDRRKTGR